MVLLIEVYSADSEEFVDYVIEASYNHPMADWDDGGYQQGATLYELLFTYIGSRQGVIGAMNYAPENRSLLSNHSNLYDRIHSTLRLPDSSALDTFVYTNDMPIDFGSRSLFTRDGLDDASAGSAYNQYLAVFGTGDSAYVMTLCQAEYWKGYDRCVPKE